MTQKPFIMPQSKIGADHAPMEWRGYWAGIEKKTCEAVADLAGGASAGDVLAKVNELLAAMRAVGLMKET